MGGKGQKRRAKNYLNSHGGDKRLPPPPNTSTIDALPSKLRKLMEFTSSLGSEVNRENSAQAQFKGDKRNAANKKSQSDAQDESKSSSINAKLDKMSAMLESEEKMKDDVVQDKKKKKKRKRKEVNDLRFQAEMEKLGVVSTRKQRKKEFLKNKKKKQKKGASEQTLDLPKRDVVKFGDVVQAPPKLAVVPKAPKKPMNASNERLRLQAIEAYRQRRGTNRLGIQLPSLTTSEEFE